MAAPKFRPEVKQARQQAAQQARAAGAKPAQVQRAIAQATQAARQALRQPTPQPPPAQPAPAPAVSGGGGYDLEYNPTLESQLNQPYQDVMATGALGAFPNVISNLQGQQDFTNLYGQGGANLLGSYMSGMPMEKGLTDQFGNQTGATLGYYGAAMDPSNQLLGGWMNELRDIQAGKADFDPFLTQQFNDQERQLRQQLQRQLGPDYENSSAGIEALSKFNQNKTTTLGSAQFQRGMDLQNAIQGQIGNQASQAYNLGSLFGSQRGQQFGTADTLGERYGQGAQQYYNQALGLRQGQLSGAGAMLDLTGQQQNLFANVPKTMGQFGEAMSGQAGQAVNAQGPMQQDRMAQFQASTFPSKGEKMGQYMAQSGDRWTKVGSSIGGMGGGTS